MQYPFIYLWVLPWHHVFFEPHHGHASCPLVSYKYVIDKWKPFNTSSFNFYHDNENMIYGLQMILANLLPYSFFNIMRIIDEWMPAHIITFYFLYTIDDVERGVLPQGGISITEQTFLMCYFCIEETFAMYIV